MTTTFDVRFHSGRANWPANPFHFRGKGQVVVEPDFVLVRGNSHRSFRFPAHAEHRLRAVDIVNAHTEGEDVYFRVQGVREDLVARPVGTGRHRGLGHLGANTDCSSRNSAVRARVTRIRQTRLDSPCADPPRYSYEKARQLASR